VREDAVLTRILTTTLIHEICKVPGLPSTQRLRRIVASILDRAAHSVLNSPMAALPSRDPG
jgi:hypothetical protein